MLCRSTNHQWDCPGQAARLILRVAVPSGLENTLFLLAKLMIGTVIATFAGAMIAANAAANTISAFVNIPGGAINLAMTLPPVRTKALN